MTTDILALIADDPHRISYRPRWNQVTGSVNATILLQQIIYWWVKNGRQPFYKFKEPCHHAACRSGDTWAEEMGFTRRELETARAKIGQRTKGEVHPQALCSYWMDAGRKTWYALNETAVLQMLQTIYGEQIEPVVGVQQTLLADSANSNADLTADSAHSNRRKTPILMAECANSNADLTAESANSNPDLLAECANSNANLTAESANSINPITTDPITTKKTKTTTRRAHMREDVVVAAVLDWIGFVGNAQDEPLTAATALAWGFWLRLHEAQMLGQGKDPVAITIASWRKGATLPTDVQQLARAWLAMTNPERRLALAAVRFHLHSPAVYLPEALTGFDIPAQTLRALYRATPDIAPPALMPGAEPDVAPEPNAISSAPDSLMTSEETTLWTAALGELQGQMTKATFAWLQGSQLQLQDVGAQVLVRNAYAADWINHRLASTVSHTLSALAGRELPITAVYAH